jgi:HAE1 family hydrophobic/amphiphilic exporter-1
MRLHHLIRRARIATIAAMFTAISVSVFAQNGQSQFSISLQQASAQAAAQPQAESVRRLSIDEAVAMAMEQNLGIRIQRFDPQIQDTSVAQARAFWAPNLTTSFNRNSQTLQSTNTFTGSGASTLNQSFFNQVIFNQTLRTGAQYSATWSNARTTTTNLSEIFVPRLGSGLNLQFSQPLMRNFEIDQIRQQVANSKKTRELSDIQLGGVITGTLRAVKNAYWDLSYAIANLKTQQQSLALSQQSLKDEQKRVEIGVRAPIDIVQAQAEVASNEERVIVAEAAIKAAQDNLRALILDPGTPDFWNVVFEPTDAASFAAQAIDTDAAVRNALDKRSDLRSAKNSLEQSETNIKYYRNQAKPEVDANVSYLTNVSGGTLLSPVTDLQAVIAGTATRTVVSQRGFGTVLGDIFQNAYPNWTVGVSINYPIGSNVSQANLARVRLQFEQAQAQLKNLEMQVATQVRGAARNVQTNQQRVRSAGASRELQEKKLEAEEKKLAAGMSSSFFVFQAQRDLAQARTIEIQAISDYNKSLVDFEAVQQVPLGGGGGGITTAGSGAVATNGIFRTQ